MRYISKDEKGYIGLFGLYIVVFLMLISFLLFVVYNIEMNYIRDEVNKTISHEIYKIPLEEFYVSNGSLSLADMNESTGNESIESKIKDAIKERFKYIGMANQNGRNMGIISLIGKEGSYDRDVRIIAGPFIRQIDKESSITVKAAAYNYNIYENTNGTDIMVIPQKKVIVRTEIRILYPRILLLGGVKGDKIEVETATGTITKSRIYLSYGDIFSVY